MVIGIDASRANVTERTGTERYAFEVITRLVPLLSGHQVRLYVREPLLPDMVDLAKLADVRVLRWSVGLLWSHLRLSWELFWHRPDVLFVPADTVPIIHPRRSVTTIHDVAFERFPELYQGKSVQRSMGWLKPLVHLIVRLITLGRYSASERDYHRWSVRQAIRACPEILTVSEFSRQEIVDLFHVDKQRITVTPLGIRQPEFFNALTPERIHTTLAKAHIERPFFLFVGRLERKKNIALIVHSYVQYRQQTEQPCDLVLVGNPGYGWDEAQSLIDASVKPFIHVLGWQSEDVVDVLQRSARCFVFISQYEGFGLPALESLSAGVPVVASRHGSLPEVLANAAYYIDTEDEASIVDGLQRCSTDETLRRDLQRRGIERARLYSWDRTAQATCHVLVQ